MNIVKPRKLEKGDVIGIIAPASAPADFSRVGKAAAYFESFGYRVKVGKNASKKRGYLAGTDDERLDDLHSMFSDKDVKAIICARGGYGSGRLLRRIDYDLIGNNPKIFIGYSDITALQLAMFSKTGLVTFAGPMAAVDFYDEVDSYAEQKFWGMITEPKSLGLLQNKEKSYSITRAADFSGILTGGNMALFCSLIGTEYMPAIKNPVLLLEDVGEVPYKIDRFLYQLEYSGILDSIYALILGDFSDCSEKDSEKPSLSLNEVLDDYLSRFKFPVISDLDHGHIKANHIIPWGIGVKFDFSTGEICFSEAAVH